jgi:hypothetical protein
MMAAMKLGTRMLEGNILLQGSGVGSVPYEIEAMSSLDTDRGFRRFGTVIHGRLRTMHQDIVRSRLGER